MSFLRPVLTPSQLQRLKDHKYHTEGVSVIEEYILVPFWNWLVELLPLWVAPNLLTVIGYFVTVVTSLLVILQDMNAEGKAPWWTYFLCAGGIFVYGTLDGLDGKQARRTGTSSPLGEVFDHGLDSTIVFLYGVVLACTVGLHNYPYLMLAFVLLVLHVCFSYHWQAYTCGICYFKRIDIAEAHYCQIISLILSGIFGQELWELVLVSCQIISLILSGIFGQELWELVLIPALVYPVNFISMVVAAFLAFLNFLSACYIALTSSASKNRTTIAGTSVISPVATPLILVTLSFFYATHSPSRLLETHAVVFLTAFCLPGSKMIMHLILAYMTKSPYPLVDSIMLGPLVACVNIYFGPFVSEIYFVTAIAAYNIVDVVAMFCVSSWQMSSHLGLPYFTVPHSPK